MTAFLLLRAVANFLRQTVDQYAAARAYSGEYRRPEVFEWDLPMKNPKQPVEIDFPYIVAFLGEGEDNGEESIATLSLAFGVYQPGTNRPDGHVHQDGAYDLLNLMEHVRIALFRQAAIEGFRIEKPYKWSIPKEQPFQFWIGHAESKWTVQAATSQELEGFLHGIE